MERRYISQAPEVRKEGDKKRAIGGVAAMVNTPTVLYESKWNGKTERLIEVIRPGAFNGVLGDDVRALVNHNDDKILGRTAADTLKVYLTSDGHLGYDVPDVPDTSYGNDLLVSVERGDVTQSSFGFSIEDVNHSREETDTEIIYTDEITKIKRLYDVSPVTFPAYQDTVTELRKAAEVRIEKYRKEQPEPPKVDPDDDLAVYHGNLKRRLKILSHKVTAL